HRQHVDPPPTVPATLVDDAQQRIPDQRRGEHRRDHGQRHLGSPEEPADDADQEQTDRDDPPPPVAAPERLEVLEALLQRRGVVRPTAQAGGQGQARVERREVTAASYNSSEALTSASTARPSASRLARPPSSRSTTASTPSTVPPSPLMAAIASWAD